MDTDTMLNVCVDVGQPIDRINPNPQTIPYSQIYYPSCLVCLNGKLSSFCQILQISTDKNSIPHTEWKKL